MTLNPILEVELFDVRDRPYEAIPIILTNLNELVAVDYVLKWVEVVIAPTNDARVVIIFLKKDIFIRFNTS